MTVQEILHWKQELRRVRQEFLAAVARGARSVVQSGQTLLGTQRVTTNFSLLSVSGHHLFRVDEQFWLFDYDGSGVYVPSEETETTEVSAHAG
jgi:hypothetical protein